MKPVTEKKLTPRAEAIHVNPSALEAFRRQVVANLIKAPLDGVLDTIEPVDPLLLKIQATTRMPGEGHTAMTFKVDNRLVGLLNALSRRQNLAALVNHLVVRGLVDVMREMQATNIATYHVSYDSNDRNALCGVDDATLLAMIRYVAENPAAGFGDA